LTAALSKALRRRGFTPVHDRGRVLTDTAVLIADGGRVMSDLAVLRDQGELFGSVASDSTLWRALDEIGPQQRERVATARARTRRRVWELIESRHGRIPSSRVADRDLGATIVIRLDATIQLAHSDKELAAGTFKGSYGHHSLTAWCDNTCESLALRLRPGNTGSNTAVDHIEVLDEAIAQLPARHRRDLLVTVDGAGATRELICHISKLNARPGRRVHYSIGFDLDAWARTAIGQVREADWEPVLDTRGQPRDPDDAGVVELTGLLRRSVGGGRLECSRFY
ncbi:MAG: transposase, partial [Actinomycetota bacterium]|nr:transposase [Actinomycetota bacterium]